MAHRLIGQERFGFAGQARPTSSPDELGKLIDWSPVGALLDQLYSAAKGEPTWPPLASSSFTCSGRSLILSGG